MAPCESLTMGQVSSLKASTGFMNSMFQYECAVFFFKSRINFLRLMTSWSFIQRLLLMNPHAEILKVLSAAAQFGKTILLALLLKCQQA
jgi:hypothetical protein